MLRPIRCTQCGNHSVATTANILAQRILCATCGHELPLNSSQPNFERQGMLRMGDDEGGDWGGGGDESAEDEEEEEEGEDGKKKKKKKKGGFMGKLIGGVIGAVVLGALCCCLVVASWMGLLPSSPPLVGEWEKVDSVMVKVKEKDDMEKEIEKEEAREVAHVLNIVKGDDKSGTGTYTFNGVDEKDNKTVGFKWKDWDKEKKTVIFETNSPDDKFWKDIKSPATFIVNASGNSLGLTSGAESMTFTKVAPPPKEDKGGGGKKGGGKRR